MAPIVNPQSIWVRQQSEESNEAQDGVGLTASGKIDQEVIDHYAHHGPSLLRYAIAIAGDGGHAQDALQETFLRYFVARSEDRQIANPKAWLFRVLRNYILDTLKAPHRRNEVAIERAKNSRESGRIRSGNIITPKWRSKRQSCWRHANWTACGCALKG